CRRELDALLLQLRDGRLDVMAHEEQLVLSRLAAPARAGMDTELTRRQLEDEPALVRLDVREPEHVAEESTRGDRIVGEDQRVGARDHAGYHRGDGVERQADGQGLQDRPGSPLVPGL